MLWILSPIPETYQTLPDLEKVSKCHDEGHYAKDIYPFVFLKEGFSPKTTEVLRELCAVNNHELLRQFAQRRRKITLKKAFIPARGRMICLNQSIVPTARSLRRPSWRVTSFPTYVLIEAFDFRESRKVRG